MIWKEADEPLNFDWIKEKGGLIITLVNDLNEISAKNGLFDHTIDEAIIQELNDLEKNRDATYKRLDKL